MAFVEASAHMEKEGTALGGIKLVSRRPLSEFSFLFNLVIDDYSDGKITRPMMYRRSRG